MKVKINDWDENRYAIQVYNDDLFGALLIVLKSKGVIHTNKEIQKGVETEVDKVEITDDKIYVWL